MRLVWVVLIVLMVGAPGPLRADFDAAVAAMRRGDFDFAFKEWMRLAEQGDMDAQFNLGIMYLKGDGIPPDAEKAIRILEKAAKKNHIRAIMVLGRIYDQGIGVPRDFQKAFDWFAKAADLGEKDGYALANILFQAGNPVKGKLRIITEEVPYDRHCYIVFDGVPGGPKKHVCAL